MAKTASETVEPIVCPQCKGERVQIHERGTIGRREDGTLIVGYDELALQCLNCHHVFTEAVTGVIEYKG